MKSRTVLLSVAAVTTAVIATVIIAQDEKPKMTLQEQIEARSAKSSTKLDPVKKKAYADGIQAVADSGVVKGAKKKGDKAPDFTLPNAAEKEITLSEALKKGPVVLTWYRGGWCPYCNIQLGAYQAILPEITELGATLIAISPELPDRSLSTKEKNNLEFEVLSDKNLKVSDDYGLIFKLTPDVAKYYKEGFDLNAYNGEDAADDELPLAATYVIDTDGQIVYSFVEANYKKRAEPDAVLESLGTLKE